MNSMNSMNSTNSIDSILTLIDFYDIHTSIILRYCEKILQRHTLNIA